MASVVADVPITNPEVGAPDVAPATPEAPVPHAPTQSAEEAAAHDEIMRQIFGDVGELISDFSCAVESTVLLHGRMYITDKFICFYSNLFGMEKKIRLPYSHITLITKEKTALVIPNAIAITTYRKEYVFRSFWDRDECFEMLKSFIKKYKGIPTSSPAQAASASASSSSNSGGNGSSPNGSSGTPASIPAASAGTRPTSTASVSSSASSISSGSDSTDDLVKKRTATEDHEVDSETGGQGTAAFTGTSLSSSKATTAAAFETECAASKLKLSVCSAEVVQCSLKDFLAYFITDGAPYSLQRHHEKIGDNSMTLNSWSEDVSLKSGGADGGVAAANATVTSTRDMRFMKVCNLPGLKQTRGVKVQKIRRFGVCGAILQTSTRLDDVPMADTFSVEEVVVIRAVGGGEDGCKGTVTLDVYLEVKFIKYTMLKSVIESNTNPEVTKWLLHFVAALKAFALSPVSSPVLAQGVKHAAGTGTGAGADDEDPPEAPEVVAASTALLAEEVGKHKLKVAALTGEVVNMSLRKFVRLFVDDDAPYSLSKHHELFKDNSMVLSKWEADGAHATRSMKFMKVCNLPGLKQTRACKSQKWRKCGSAGLVLYTSTKLDDVPCADTFTVDDCFVVRKAGPGKVTVDATMEVKFVKSTMMKSFIESNTNKEVVKWCQDYLDALRKYASSQPGAVPTAAVAPAAAGSEGDDVVAVPSGFPPASTHPIDVFFEQFGFYGGRYIVAMFAIVLLLMLYFGLQWRSTAVRLAAVETSLEEVKGLLRDLAQKQVCKAK